MFINYKRYECRYPLYGGMQDWNYIHAGCFELTLEISDNKWPTAAEVSGISSKIIYFFGIKRVYFLAGVVL
jgi:hypothetical protein